ncbi:hypothetical protein [Pinibacter soli]|uniref:Uncharacterized protein n=1 Tax=Pinibacter soli TaxID=3044211 RepID=A0ABT6RII9_9BACT|nr:hypothetical protein [Pinibacter soli]MDI3322236.1 hypothetical protein [Pinibacter soli]
MLKDFFFDLLDEYTTNNTVIANCWEEIEKSYGNKKRYYHNLSHLENLHAELTACKDQIAMERDDVCALLSRYSLQYFQEE